MDPCARRSGRPAGRARARSARPAPNDHRGARSGNGCMRPLTAEARKNARQGQRVGTKPVDASRGAGAGRRRRGTSTAGMSGAAAPGGRRPAAREPPHSATRHVAQDRPLQEQQRHRARISVRTPATIRLKRITPSCAIMPPAPRAAPNVSLTSMWWKDAWSAPPAGSGRRACR